MATVNTVMGPIDTDELGFTLSHEHVGTNAAGLRHTYPGLDIQYEDKAEDMLLQVSALLGKQKQLVMRDYDKAMRLNPEFAAAYHNRAIVHAEGRCYQQAATDFVNAMAGDARYADAYGDIYAQTRSALFPERVTAGTTEAYLQRAKAVGFMVSRGWDEGWRLTL